MKPYIVTFVPGDSWVTGKGSRERPHWDAHADFMDALFAADRIILGGPLVDYSHVIIIINAESEIEVKNLFMDDPFLTQRILNIQSIDEWLIFLDSRKVNS